MPPSRSTPPLRVARVLLLLFMMGPARAIDFAGIASMLAKGYMSNAGLPNDTTSSGRSGQEPVIINTATQQKSTADKPLSYSSLLEALRRQSWVSISDSIRSGGASVTNTAESTAENSSTIDRVGGGDGCGSDCTWSPASAVPDGSYKVLYPVEDGIQEKSPDHNEDSPTQRGPAAAPEPVRAEPRFSPSVKRPPSMSPQRPDSYSGAGRVTSYQAPTLPSGPSPSAYEYNYPPFSDVAPPRSPAASPAGAPVSIPPPATADSPMKIPMKSSLGNPAFLPYAPDSGGNSDYNIPPVTSSQNAPGYFYNPPPSNMATADQGYNYSPPRTTMGTSNEGYDYSLPSGVPSQESKYRPPMSSPPEKTKLMKQNIGSPSKPNDHKYLNDDKDFSFDFLNEENPPTQYDMNDPYYGPHSHDFSFNPSNEEDSFPPKDNHHEYYSHDDDDNDAEYTFHPGSLPTPTEDDPVTPHKSMKDSVMKGLTPTGKPMTYDHPGVLPHPEDDDYSEQRHNAPPSKPYFKPKPTNHYPYSHGYFDHEDFPVPHTPPKVVAMQPPPSPAPSPPQDNKPPPPMKSSKAPARHPFPPEPQPPPPQIFYHNPNAYHGESDHSYHGDDPHSLPGKLSKPTEMSEPPEPPSQPMRHHKPPTNHDYHHSDYEYDYEDEHEHHSVTPPEPPKDEEERVNKRPYSYYHFGRKLWYIPLYFSVYFIIYVTALIIKAIARHKIQYPLYYAGTAKDSDHQDHHSRRRRYTTDDQLFLPGPMEVGLDLLLDLSVEVGSALENGRRLYEKR